ncbi:four-carbon acid sugar kinase family protein, partial [Clostridium sp.]|uniref:four-carbon acid sugar kinase family protein n=1 Tax=Clostridium sp. TaxID=1506 RepID=UPI0035A0B946
VVSISTDSRAVKKDIAYKRVNEVVEFFNNYDVKLFAKRIDSTLRGNIGAEIDGVLDGLPEDTIAVVVPSFPTSGRVCVGGYLMVDQIPLEKTDVANDPKNPIKTSRVVSIIKSQTNKRVGFIDLDKVLDGVDSIKNGLTSEIQNGSRIIIVDAATDEDIKRIAKAVKEINIKAVAVDPGPFTAALAEELLGETRIGHGKKLMLTVGSVSNLTRRQM